MVLNNKKSITILIVACFLVSSVFGATFGVAGGIVGGQLLKDVFSETQNANLENAINRIVSEESAITEAVEMVSPAVVSIIVTKDLPKIEQYWGSPFEDGDDFFGDFFNFRVPMQRQNGTEKKEIGGGTGFIISSDGMIVTNRHVVLDEEAEYTVLMNNGLTYEASVLARDETNDLAVIKIDEKDLPIVELGDSDSIKIGQSVIAIGNALGEFRNTVSVGVVSGLSRSITAGSGISGQTEQLTGVIQTDAAINPGNSGGPLVNSAGQVIGINTAIVSNAQNIGFAIPINDIKTSIESVNKYGKIRKPYLGVRYVMINSSIQSKNNLPVDHGALIARGESVEDLAVLPGSPADKANLRENDIILEINDIELDQENDLASVIKKQKIGEEIKLKVLSQGETKELTVILEEYS